MAVKTRAKAQSKSQPKDESSSLLNNALGQIEKAFGVGFAVTDPSGLLAGH